MYMACNPRTGHEQPTWNLSLMHIGIDLPH